MSMTNVIKQCTCSGMWNGKTQPHTSKNINFLLVSQRHVEIPCVTYFEPVTQVLCVLLTLSLWLRFSMWEGSDSPSRVKPLPLLSVDTTLAGGTILVTTSPSSSSTSVVCKQTPIDTICRCYMLLNMLMYMQRLPCFVNLEDTKFPPYLATCLEVYFLSSILLQYAEISHIG